MIQQVRYKVQSVANEINPVVPIQALRENLRLQSSELDSALLMFLTNAIDFAEIYTGRVFQAKTIEAYIDRFPIDGILLLDKGPVNEIISIGYYAEGEDVMTRLPADKYQLDNVEMTARILFSGGVVADPYRLNAIKITYTAGYTVETLPKSVRDAIILLASQRFLHADNDAVDRNITVAQNFMEQYKPHKF